MTTEDYLTESEMRAILMLLQTLLCNKLGIQTSSFLQELKVGTALSDATILDDVL